MEAALLIKMGWTPQQLDDAPDHIVRAILEVLNAEAEKSREDNG